MFLLDLRYDFWSWGQAGGPSTVTANLSLTARCAKTMNQPAVCAKTSVQAAAFTQTINEPAIF